MIPFRTFHNHLPIAAVVCLSALSMAVAAPELKLVNVVFRHGDRTPDSNGLEMYPNDPYINSSFYPMGLGQLTLEGKKREYKLGTALRARYDKFLGKLYLPKLVLAQSSDYDRTKMSLQLVLAGLFPPAYVQQWNKHLNWQPIPASYVPRVDDNIFLPDECPGYIQEYERVLNLPEVQKLMHRHKDMMSNLTKLTGKKIEKPIDIFFLYHSLVAETFLGLPLPDWVYDYFPQGELFDGIVSAYTIYNYNTLLKRLFAGPLIRLMIDNMINTQNGKSSETKIHLYSGHETNIASLLHAFDVYEPHVPEYSSAIILELQKIDSEYYVKLLYYLGIPPVIKTLKLPNCEELCLFDRFLDLIAELIPSDEELICDKRQTPDYADTPYPPAIQALIYDLLQSTQQNEVY